MTRGNGTSIVFFLECHSVIDQCRVELGFHSISHSVPRQRLAWLKKIQCYSHPLKQPRALWNQYWFSCPLIVLTANNWLFSCGGNNKNQSPDMNNLFCISSQTLPADADDVDFYRLSVSSLMHMSDGRISPQRRACEHEEQLERHYLFQQQQRRGDKHRLCTRWLATRSFRAERIFPCERFESVEMLSSWSIPELFPTAPRFFGKRVWELVFVLDVSVGEREWWWWCWAWRRCNSLRRLTVSR